VTRSVRTLLRHAVPLAALSLGTGCAMQYSARTLGVPVTMAEPLAQAVPGDSFHVTLKAIHLFWGLATTKQPNLQQVLAGQLGTGGAVHGLTIRQRKRWSDVLFTGLTLGLISPTSVTFSGVVTRGSP